MSVPELHCHHSENEQIIRSLPDNSAIEKVSEIFRLISDPTRLKILLLLCHCEECVNNIAIMVNMSAPAVSHHLRLLKQAGLITSSRLGKEIHYKLSDTPEASLLHRSVDDIFDIRCPR